MNRDQRTYRSLRYYFRFYGFILIAAFLANTIISGSFIVGDSIQHTLLMRVKARLGRTETMISSGSGFMNASVMKHQSLRQSASGVLCSDGFYQHQEIMQHVNVWGIDSTFQNLSAHHTDLPPASTCFVNQWMMDQFKLNLGDEIVVRMPNMQTVPSGSLFITDTYTTSVRLEIAGVLDDQMTGNLSIRNEQQQPFNVFLNIHNLQELLKLEDKCNALFLTDSEIDVSKFIHPELMGFSSTTVGEDVYIRSDRLFISDEFSRKIIHAFPETEQSMSYFVEGISAEQGRLHYAFATACETFRGESIASDGAILSDYTAKALNVSVGDSIELSSYKMNKLRALHTDNAALVVEKIVPIGALKQPWLKADFPGLSDVHDCKNWDSALPIDMSLVSEADESYWDDHGQTPKLLVSHQFAKVHWSNDYGSATLLKIPKNSYCGASYDSLFSGHDLGLVSYELKHSGIEGALGGVDFKSLFLSLAFFILMAALLLGSVPVRRMLLIRKSEIEQYASLGFTRKQIIILFTKEYGGVVCLGALFGIFGAVVFNQITLLALSSIWNGAVNTQSFFIDIKGASLLLGTVATILVTFTTGTLQIRSQLMNKKKNEGHHRKNPSYVWLILLGVVLVMSIGYGLFGNNAQLAFLLTGFSFFLFSILFFDQLIKRRVLLSGASSNQNMMLVNIYANRNLVKQSIIILASGVYVVFVVGLNRVNFSDAKQFDSKTGGYQGWLETRVPLQFDINRFDSKTEYGLQSIDSTIHFTHLFRKDYDQASCLNLNQVSMPSVLGIPVDEFSADERFQIKSTLDDVSQSQIWASMRSKNENVYPVLCDETVMQWSLMKGLGDSLQYVNSRNDTIFLQLIGGLNNTIFQGHVLMDAQLMQDIWPDISGSNITLISSEQEIAESEFMMMRIALRNYGVNIETCVERLQAFYQVTDSYLTIFLMLGSFGLMLGIVGMIFLQLKNIEARRKEIDMMRALGFSVPIIRKSFYREGVVVLTYSIFTGVIAALLSTAHLYQASSLMVWIIVVLSLFLLLVISVLLTKYMTRTAIKASSNFL